MSPINGFATHSLAHVYEHEGRYKEGLSFLTKTEDNWKFCTNFKCHIYWHKALFMIEEKNYEGAIEIWKDHIYPIALRTKIYLYMADMVSLLYRIYLTGSASLISSTDWNNAFNICKPFLKLPSYGFYDAILLMSCLGSEHIQEAEEVIENISSAKFTDPQITKPLLQSMLAYQKKQYDDVVKLLYPIRYKIVQLGGSSAQRDVFNQILILAALKSSSDFNRKVAEQLLIEREANKPNSPLTNRLVIQLAEK